MGEAVRDPGKRVCASGVRGSRRSRRPSGRTIETSHQARAAGAASSHHDQPHGDREPTRPKRTAWPRRPGRENRGAGSPRQTRAERTTGAARQDQNGGDHPDGHRLPRPGDLLENHINVRDDNPPGDHNHQPQEELSARTTPTTLQEGENEMTNTQAWILVVSVAIIALANLKALL